MNFNLKHYWVFHTESGKVFYKYAKQLIAAEEQQDYAMRAQSHPNKVHIGVAHTIGSYYLPSIVEQYQYNCGDSSPMIYIRRLIHVPAEISSFI